MTSQKDNSPPEWILWHETQEQVGIQDAHVVVPKHAITGEKRSQIWSAAFGQTRWEWTKQYWAIRTEINKQRKSSSSTTTTTTQQESVTKRTSLEEDFSSIFDFLTIFRFGWRRLRAESRAFLSNSQRKYLDMLTCGTWLKIVMWGTQGNKPQFTRHNFIQMILFWLGHNPFSDGGLVNQASIL